MMGPIKPLALLAPALLLAGCISLGGKVPERLLTLTATSAAPAGSTATASQASALQMVEFDVPAALDNTRVPVQASDTELAYLKDAMWVEKPGRLMRRLIAETIRARSGRMVVDGDDPGVLANDRLQGTLRTFGYDARTSEVVAVFDAVRDRKGSTVEVKRFEARVPGITPDVAAVGPALNQAANEIARQVADWAG